jgi:hypothetical protein
MSQFATQGGEDLIAEYLFHPNGLLHGWVPFGWKHSDIQMTGLFTEKD